MYIYILQPLYSYKLIKLWLIQVKIKSAQCDNDNYCKPKALKFFLLISELINEISHLKQKHLKHLIILSTCRFAGAPTSLSPSGKNAITDGVVREPSEFSITRGADPSMTATHEFVVPRSIPMTFPCTELYKKTISEKIQTSLFI